MSMFSIAPFSPMHQALIHPRTQRQGTTQYVPGVSNPDMDMGDPDANRLQMAQNLAVARQGRGQSATSQQSFSSGPSPLQRAVIAAKGQMLSQMTDLGDDEKEQYGKLQQDPNLSLQQFHQVISSRPKAAKAGKAPPVQHDFGGSAQPSNPGAGSMSVQQGTGPNAMSPEAMQAWQSRVRGAAAAGEQVQGTPEEADSQGFVVNGMNGQRQPGPQDHIVNMVNSLKGHVTDDDLTRLQSLANSGATAEQVYAAGQHLLTAGAGAGKAADRQAIAGKRQRLGDLRRQNSQLQKSHFGFQGVNSEADFTGNDPETLAEKQAYHQYTQNEQAMQGLEGELENPGQQQTAAPQQQPAAQQGPAIPHPQFDASGNMKPGSRGVISPDLAGHYLQRVGGDIEKAKQAARSEGWQVP